MTYLITAPFLDLAFRGFCIIAGVFAVGVLVGSYRRAFKAARELSKPEPRPKPDNPLTRQWIPPVPQEPTP